MDNREEVYSILSSTAENVDYRYPQDLLDDNYPKVCYFTSNITDTAYEDNKSTMTTVDTTIQIYEKMVDGELVEIHNEVIEAMRQAGFKLTFYDNFYDTNDKTHLHTARFTKIYDK